MPHKQAREFNYKRGSAASVVLLVSLAFSLGAVSGFMFGSASGDSGSYAALVKNIFAGAFSPSNTDSKTDKISLSRNSDLSPFENPRPDIKSSSSSEVANGSARKTSASPGVRKSVSARKTASSASLAVMAGNIAAAEKSGNKKSQKAPSDSGPVPDEKNSYCDFSTGSEPSHKVLINEIAWMGSPAAIRATINNPDDAEWIELKNTSLQSVDLGNWQLLDRTGKFRIKFPVNLSVAPSGYFLLEHLSDDAVVGITADLIFQNNVPDSGMRLKLFDGSCNPVDEIVASSKWPGGIDNTKQTLERDSNIKGWHTSVFAGGTPKALNTVPSDYGSPVGQGILAASEAYGLNKSVYAPSSGAGNSSYPSLVISEVQLSSSSSTHQEFVEIWNPGSVTADLTGWYIQKKTKTAKDYSTFAPKDSFAGKTVPAGGFLLIAHPSSTISADIYSACGLSDDNSLVLKNPDGDVADLVGWGEAGDCESGCAPDPADGQSIQRKISGGKLVDTENNSADFEISDCPSPGAFTASVCGTGSVSGSGGAGTSGTSTVSVATSSSATILIAAVQITGGTGKTDNDFIKLYNPGPVAIDLSGWKLRKRTSTGSESSIKQMSSGDIIPAGGYFIWSNSKDGFDLSVGANVSTTGTLSANNSIGLIRPDGTLSDALAWGSGLSDPFVEGSPVSSSPGANQIITRKSSATGLQDTDNNSADFEIR